MTEDKWNIALYEEWAQGLVYCDMEGFAITDDGYLVLMDECGHVVYCDTDRFKVMFDDESPHGKWKYIGTGTVEKAKCSVCSKITITEPFGEPPFCPWCGSKMKGSG